MCFSLIFDHEINFENPITNLKMKLIYTNNQLPCLQVLFEGIWVFRFSLLHFTLDAACSLSVMSAVRCFAFT